MKFEIASLKEKQEKLILSPTIYPELIPATQELNTFKTIKDQLVALRMPITKKLDELKAELMMPEKKAAEHIQMLEQNIRQIKIELKKKQDEANAKIQQEKQKEIDQAKAKLKFMKDFKDLSDKAIDFWFSSDKVDEESFIKKIYKRIEKLDGTAQQKKEAKDTFRNVFLDNTMNNTHVSLAPLIEEEHKKVYTAIISSAATPDVIIEGADVKEISLLDMPDDWNTLRQILISWISDFETINSGLRNKSVFSIQISSVVSVIEKNAEKYNNLNFKKDIK